MRRVAYQYQLGALCMERLLIYLPGDFGVLIIKPPSKLVYYCPPARGRTFVEKTVDPLLMRRRFAMKIDK